MLGAAIKEERSRQKISQRLLAERAGVSRTHLVSLESGANVSVDVVLRVAGALGMTRIPLTESLALETSGMLAAARIGGLARAASTSARTVLERLSEIEDALDTQPKKKRQKTAPVNIWKDRLPIDFPVQRVENWVIDNQRWVEAEVVAWAAAGSGIIETNDPEQILIPEDLLPKEGEFLLRAVGESMIDAGIESGDILVVEGRKGGVAATNEAVIGWLNSAKHGEGLVVKRWYHKRGKKMLISANEDMPAIELEPGDSFELQGIVRRSFRPQRPTVRDYSKISG